MGKTRQTAYKKEQLGDKSKLNRLLLRKLATHLIRRFNNFQLCFLAKCSSYPPTQPNGFFRNLGLLRKVEWYPLRSENRVETDLLQESNPGVKRWIHQA